jgi:hypothetical protein
MVGHDTRFHSPVSKTTRQCGSPPAVLPHKPAKLRVAALGVMQEAMEIARIRGGIDAGCVNRTAREPKRTEMVIRSLVRYVQMNISCGEMP